MTQVDVHLPQRREVARFGATTRKDRWWLQPLIILLALSAFILYTTWAAFQGEHYFYGGGGAHYLSPFYSPLIFGQEGEPRWFAAPQPGWWPTWAPFSPAFLILAFPAMMRFTCYYYRGAYYKSFWGAPPACAVGGPHGGRYTGERRFPLILQNIHRYVFYCAAVFVFILLYDAWKAMWFTMPDGSHRFGIGLGSVVLLVNALLLGGYTFGCHCARHLCGGSVDCLSQAPVRKTCYHYVSVLNRRHMLWAWTSLVWVAWSDIYVRMLSMGWISYDPRIVF
jgi:hypothetical protein